VASLVVSAWPCVGHRLVQRIDVAELPVEGVVAVAHLVAQRVALPGQAALQVVELERGVAELGDGRGLAAEEVDARQLGAAERVDLLYLGAERVVLEAPRVAERVGVGGGLVVDVVGVAVHRAPRGAARRIEHRCAEIGELAPARVEGRERGDEVRVRPVVAEEPRLEPVAVAVDAEAAPQAVVLVGRDLGVERVELVFGEVARSEAVAALRAALLAIRRERQVQRREERSRVERPDVQARVERDDALSVAVDEAAGLPSDHDVRAVGEGRGCVRSVDAPPLHDHFVAEGVVVENLQVVLPCGQVAQRRRIRI
jgi:hypothetical protein